MSHAKRQQFIENAAIANFASQLTHQSDEDLLGEQAVKYAKMLANKLYPPLTVEAQGASVFAEQVLDWARRCGLSPNVMQQSVTVKHEHIVELQAILGA